MSQKKIIHAVPGANLLCDSCGYVEPVEAMAKDLIGTACPKCGANMLTAEDYQSALETLELVDAFNAIADAIGVGSEAPPEDCVPLRIIRHNGTTKIVVGGA